MIQLNIKTDIRQAERFYTNLRRNAVKKAAARAINDTLITLRAEGARAIKKQHPALKIGDIKNAMKMDKANQYSLRGMVSTRGQTLSLTLFSPSGGGQRFRFSKTGRAGIYNAGRAARAPVTARIGTQRKVMQYQGRKAFRVAKYGNEIFVRRNATGRQLRRLKGPSLPGVFRAQRPYFQGIVDTRWPINFRSRMAYEIEQAKR